VQANFAKRFLHSWIKECKRQLYLKEQQEAIDTYVKSELTKDSFNQLRRYSDYRRLKQKKTKFAT
jgi:hypothetical protein